MLQLFQTWIQQDPIVLVTALGYVGVGALVFAESGILLGVVLPGDSLLFAAGLLAASGLLNVYVLASVVVVAAIVGDSVGYWFGRRVGRALFARPDSRVFKQEYVQRTQMFYLKYGGRAVVLARFLPVLRTLAPILAGVGSMPYAEFVSYNVVGGLVWGAGLVLAGYFLGTLVPGSESYILPLSLVVVIVSFVPVVVGALRKV